MVPNDVVSAADLAFLGAATTRGPAAPPAAMVPLYQARDAWEREYILGALGACDGNMSRAADTLGVERSNLYRKMRGLGIAPGRKEEADIGDESDEVAGSVEGQTGSDPVLTTHVQLALQDLVLAEAFHFQSAPHWAPSARRWNQPDDPLRGSIRRSALCLTAPRRREDGVFVVRQVHRHLYMPRSRRQASIVSGKADCLSSAESPPRSLRVSSRLVARCYVAGDERGARRLPRRPPTMAPPGPKSASRLHLHLLASLELAATDV
jgi:hypothetical protein